jgi:hypothetical protein
MSPAQRLRSGHIATLLDMDRNNTATNAVGSACRWLAGSAFIRRATPDGLQ